MNNREWFLVFLLGAVWGSSFLFVEILLSYLSPITIVFLRVSIASLFLIFFIIIKQEKFKFSFIIIFNLFVMGLLNNVIPFSLIAIGQQTTTGGLASILNANTSIIAIIIASVFIPSEKLTLNRVGGVTVGLVGVIIVIGYQNIFNLFENNMGKYLILIATVSYAFASVWAKLRLKSIPPLISATGMLTMSSIMLSPYVLIVHSNELLSINFSIFIYAFLFAIICSILAYFLYFKILESTGAGNLLICTIIIPPFAILLNAIVLQQIITVSEFLGLVIIIFGLIILDGRLLSKKIK